MNEIKTIKMDLAKHVFQVHGVDAAGECVLRKRLRPGQLVAFFFRLPRCLVGLFYRWRTSSANDVPRFQRSPGRATDHYPMLKNALSVSSAEQIVVDSPLEGTEFEL